MQDKKIRLGIIGFGRMGITHYSIINTHPNIEILGVTDPSKNITVLLEKYINNLKVFDDYRQMIKFLDLDAVLICTPPKFHFEISKYAYENNLHVFVEKPFTTNLNDAEKLKDLFNNKNLVNQVGYVNRFNDVFIKTKSYLETGLIGDLISFKSEMYSATVSRKESSKSWRTYRDNGSGVVYEIAAHAIDLVGYMFGKPDKVVGTYMNKVFSKNNEDIVSSTLLYKDGISGNLYVNWSDVSYRKPSNKIELFGTKGKIIADNHGIKIFMNVLDKKSGFKKGWNNLSITDIFKNVPFYVRGNEFTRQLYHFVDSILGIDNVKICDFNDACDAHYIMEQLYTDYNKNLTELDGKNR